MNPATRGSSLLASSRGTSARNTCRRFARRSLSSSRWWSERGVIGGLQGCSMWLLAYTLCGVLFVDVVAEEAPGRRRAGKAAPGIERDAGILEGPADQLDLEHAVAL